MLTLLFSAAVLQGAVAAQPPTSLALDRAEAYFERTGGHAFLVMHRGQVVREAYRNGGRADRRQLLASGSKSFVGVATIAAVQDGLLRLDAPAATYLTEWRTDERKRRITVRQLLSLESGLDSGNPGTGCGGRGATWSDAIGAGTFAEPGTAFRYGPFPFIAMGAALERVQRQPFDEYLQARVLDPLGVRVEWRATCGDGKPQLAGGATMTARDWAVFGEMIRRGGVHDGRRILDEALVRELFRPSGSNPNYGLSWWLAGATMLDHPVGASSADGAPGADGGRRGRLRDRLAARRQRPGSVAQASAAATPSLPAWLPRDVVMAAGAGNQRLYLIPSRDLVVVRLGPLLDRGGFSDRAFLEALLAP